MKENKKRSIAKAISWRITGTIDTFVISFIITGKLIYASTISLTEIVTKIFLYYIHERAWNKINWGKPKHEPVHEHKSIPLNLHRVKNP